LVHPDLRAFASLSASRGGGGERHASSAYGGDGCRVVVVRGGQRAAADGSGWKSRRRHHQRESYRLFRGRARATVTKTTRCVIGRVWWSRCR